MRAWAASSAAAIPRPLTAALTESVPPITLPNFPDLVRVCVSVVRSTRNIEFSVLLPAITTKSVGLFQSSLTRNLGT